MNKRMKKDISGAGVRPVLYIPRESPVAAVAAPWRSRATSGWNGITAYSGTARVPSQRGRGIMIRENLHDDTTHSPRFQAKTQRQSVRGKRRCTLSLVMRNIYPHVIARSRLPMPVVPNSYVCAEKSEKRAWRSQAALRAHGLARSLLIDCPVACANNRPSARSDHTGWGQWRKAATS